MGAFKQTYSLLSPPDRIAKNARIRTSGRLRRPRSAGPAQTALGQVILADRRSGGVDGDEAVLGPHGRQYRQVALDLTPHAAERDAEHTLAALEQVYYLIRGGALIDTDPVAHQGDLG